MDHYDNISNPKGGIRDVMNIINKHIEPLGGSVQLKRQSKNESVGQHQNADEDGEEVLKQLEVQESVKKAADKLKDCTFSEKLKWAKDMRSKGNDLYKDQRYIEACNIYVTSLAALDFKENLNVSIEKIQLPVLSNMAASWIALKDWNKVIVLCDQAAALNHPEITNQLLFWKCKLRRATAQIHIGDLKLAAEEIEATQKYSDTNDNALRKELLQCKKLLAAAGKQMKLLHKTRSSTARKMFAPENAGIYEDKIGDVISSKAGENKANAIFESLFDIPKRLLFLLFMFLLGVITSICDNIQSLSATSTSICRKLKSQQNKNNYNSQNKKDL